MLLALLDKKRRKLFCVSVMNVTGINLKAILAARGMSYRDLASLTGFRPGTLRNLACGNSRSMRGRARVEACLVLRSGLETWLSRTRANSAEGPLHSSGNTADTSAEKEGRP